MEKTQISAILQKQKEYFRSGATFPVEARITALKTLARAIDEYEERIISALKTDLGKSRTESYMCEIGMMKSEISFLLRNVKKYCKPRRVKTPMTQFPAKSAVYPCPYGSVLVISPWNYPLLLSLEPLCDALSAGNTVVLKPSAYSPATSAVLQEMLETYFSPEQVAVVCGGRAENACLLELPFDYIFFTGSKSVGKEVMRKASEHLTPVTLELGGKSPCIVEKTADIPLTAKRIVFGKYLNCGQTCVAPDYIYCDKSIKEELIAQIKKQITLQFGKNPLENPDYGKIINGKHFARLNTLIAGEKLLCGGETNEKTLQIAPTVLEATFSSPAMQEEIFGPILPILTYENFDEIIPTLSAQPHPLALYIFSSDKQKIDLVLRRISFGGGCVNDVIVHLATSEMPFGGVGESGMGAYHGKRGFDTFTHEKSILDKKTYLDLPMRYQPYTPKKEKLIRKYEK